MNDHIIEVRDVWKVYRIGDVDLEAVRNLTLKVDRGDYISIMGPSGSGKSTLLNLLGLLDTPTRGTVRVAGQDASDMKDGILTDVRARRIGFVFQYFALIPMLTALGNVEIQLKFAGIGRKERQKLALAALERVGLGDRGNHHSSELSGGEQQRVAIARAIAKRPEIVLADEPTGNLDSKTGDGVIELLEGLHDDGITLLVVTHNPQIAEMAERKISMRDGSIERES